MAKLLCTHEKIAVNVSISYPEMRLKMRLYAHQMRLNSAKNQSGITNSTIQ